MGFNCILCSVFGGAFGLWFLAVLWQQLWPGRSIKYKGKHVLVTGGSAGMGLELAKQYVLKGAKVTIVARNPKKLSDALRSLHAVIPADGAKEDVIAVASDATDPKAVTECVHEAVQKNGEVDILVTAAGMSVPGYFEELPVKVFEDQMKVNYLGSVYYVKAVIPSMQARKSGRVILFSSMGGLAGVFGYTAYSPSKFALRGFAEALHQEMQPYNINVHVVLPPDVDTPGFANENKTKPRETVLISEGAGLFTADDVARSIMRQVQKGSFFLSFGFDGTLLTWLCVGMAPGFDLLGTSLLSLVRVVSYGYARMHAGIIAKEHDARKKKA